MAEWVAQNVQRVRKSVAAACERAGRDPQQVTLIGVTKGVTPEMVRVAWNAGVRHFGENRIQEAQPKIAALADLTAAVWHLIGHVQTNKAKPAVELFAMVHSVDSIRIADALSARAAQIGKRLAVWLEVNVSGEASKQGVAPSAAEALARHLRNAPALEWRGLMTIAPLSDDAEQARQVFRALRELRDTLQRAIGVNGLQLSMGMSHDFTVAVEEGADLVRIGSAIFQEQFRHGR